MQRTRSRYTASDRARVLAELSANEGNIKRTARNTSIPVSTVRDWKTEWEMGGVEPEVVEALPAVVTDFVEDATRVRDKLLIKLDQMIEQDKLNGTQVVTAIGVLTDKIRAYKGLDQVKEHHHTIDVPALGELQARLDGALKELVAAGRERQRVIDEVVDLEPSQYRELQPATEE